MKRATVLICALLSGISAYPVHSSVVYSYSGPSYEETFNNIGGTFPAYDGSMNLTVSFEVASPLEPNTPLGEISGSVLGYSFADGIQLLDETNSDLTLFLIGTDSVGKISEWSLVAEIGFPDPVAVGSIYRQISTFSVASNARDLGVCPQCITKSANNCELTRVNLGRIIDSPGIWSTVPVPSGLWLISMGLIGVLVNLRSKG